MTLYHLLLLVVLILAPVPVCWGAWEEKQEEMPLSCRQLWQTQIHNYEQRRLTRTEALQQHTTNAKYVWDPWEPEWRCETEERFGVPAWGDGAKFVCHPTLTLQRQPCLVYSFGSNGKIQFETAVHQLAPHCEIHVFDPTDDAKTSAIVSSVGTFHRWGLGDKEQSFSLGKLMTLPHIMNELGHQGRRLNLLKVDVEGAEWDSFNHVIWPLCANDTSVILMDQLQIELHLKGSMNQGDRTVIERFFEGAERCGFMIFHKERNGWGCSGFRCLEYALIHKQAALDAFVDTHCPSVPKETSLPSPRTETLHDRLSALQHHLNTQE